MADMGKMIGPLPMGAWAAVIAGGLGIAVYTRKAGAGASAAPGAVDDTSGVPGVGDGSVGGWTATGGGSGGTTDATASPIYSRPTDNDQWGQQAINWLISQGYDATVSDSAVRKYLQGENMSASEYVLIGRALMHLGATPTLLPPPTQVTGVPGPTPTTPPPPVIVPPAPKPHQGHQFTYYTVKRGDSLYKIGHQYKIGWPAIYNANRKGRRRRDGKIGMISNPNHIEPGWVLLIK